MSNARLVEINLDKPRHLLLNMNAMAEFERAVGVNFMEYSRKMLRRSIAYARKAMIENGKKMDDGSDVPEPNEADLQIPDMTINELRSFLWCLLIHEDESLTIKQVGAMINSGNIQVVMESVLRAQTINSPKSEVVQEQNKGEPQPPLAESPQS
jgi:hypothetical protein